MEIDGDSDRCDVVRSLRTDGGLPDESDVADLLLLSSVSGNGLRLIARG